MKIEPKTTREIFTDALPADHAVYDLSRAISNVRADLARELRKLAQRAVDDAERIARGQMPWYSSSSYVADGAEIARAHTSIELMTGQMRDFRYIAQEQPESMPIAACVFGLARFFCGAVQS